LANSLRPQNVAPAVLAQPASAGLPPAAPVRGLLQAAAIALVLVLAGLALRQTALGTLHALHPTPAGALFFVVLGAVLSGSGLPRQVVAFAGGYVFGAWIGGSLSLAAQLLGCILDYLAARGVAARWAHRMLGRGPKRAALRRVLELHPFSATLTFRLLPVGNNLVLNLLAGVASVRLAPFLGATMLGYVPQTAIFALFGSGVQVGRRTQLAIAIVLFAAAAAVGLALFRRVGASLRDTPDGPIGAGP